jgi:hypothetical protein
VAFAPHGQLDRISPNHQWGYKNREMYDYIYCTHTSVLQVLLVSQNGSYLPVFLFLPSVGE